MDNRFMKYNSLPMYAHRRPMSLDTHGYNFLNEMRHDTIGGGVQNRHHNHNNRYDHQSLQRRTSFSSSSNQHNRLLPPPLLPQPQTINLDEFSENSSFSDDEDDDDLSSSHNAFCSTSDMTTSDSEIYSRDSKLRYMHAARMMKNRPAQISLESKFPHLSPIYPEDSISSDNDDHFEYDDDFLGGQHRFQLTPSRVPKELEMIQEISPVLPETSDVQTEEELPPVIKPLKLLHKEWRPLQTSTMMSVHPARLPKTNPRLGSVSSTPRHNMARRRLLQTENHFDEPKSLFDPCYVDMRSVKKNTLKPKHFGLPSQIAKMYGVKGILYLEIFSTGRYVEVKILNASYFLDHRISSFVKLELKRNLKRNRKRSKNATSRRFPDYRTITIPHNNEPIFDETFKFRLSKAHIECHDMLGINVYATRSSSVGKSEISLLGCMSFHLRRLYKKVGLKVEHIFNDDSYEPILVGNGGYFLLDESKGSHQNLPENKVYHRKYYDEIGSSLSSSLNSSPSKIMGESEWRGLHFANSHHLYNEHRIHSGQEEVLTRLAVSPLKKPIESSAEVKRNWYRENGRMAPWPQASTSESTKNNRGVNTLDYTSSSSSSGIGREYKRHYRFTLPSITTSDATGSEISNECRSGGGRNGIVDYNYLYADPSLKIPEGLTHSGEDERKSSENNKENGVHHHHPHQRNDIDDKEEKFVRPVRRVHSFATERDNLAKRKQERKKSSFGPISRTFQFLKHKIDSAMSTSTLYPPQEDVREWANSFESLISHKYGSLLFKEYLKIEKNEEGLLFWFEVEEFKKMKPGKKSLARAHQIYNEYIEKQAPNEVNLEPTIKDATKAALESGAKPDMFNLAQTHTEQLLKKDPYTRFLKWSVYLNMLNGDHTDHQQQHRSSQASIASADPMGYTCENKRGSAASDTGTMVVHMDSPKHVVLVE